MSWQHDSKRHSEYDVVRSALRLITRGSCGLALPFNTCLTNVRPSQVQPELQPPKPCLMLPAAGGQNAYLDDFSFCCWSFKTCNTPDAVSLCSAYYDLHMGTHSSDLYVPARHSSLLLTFLTIFCSSIRKARMILQSSSQKVNNSSSPCQSPELLQSENWLLHHKALTGPGPHGAPDDRRRYG